MAVRVGEPLVILMFPPLALERRFAVPAGSDDETRIRVLFTFTRPLFELRLTVPPAPSGCAAFVWISPVVASIFAPFTVRSPVVLTVKVPPLPGKLNRLG